MGNVELKIEKTAHFISKPTVVSPCNSHTPVLSTLYIQAEKINYNRVSMILVLFFYQPSKNTFVIIFIFHLF